MTKSLAQEQNLEQYKLELLEKYIEGADVAKTYKYKEQEPEDYNEFHEIKKSEYGLVRSACGTIRKHHQKTANEALLEAGEEIEHYNGAIIDGEKYIESFKATQDLTIEQHASREAYLAILHHAGEDITNTRALRERLPMKKIGSRFVQHYNRLRNKYCSAKTFEEMVEEHMEASLDNLLNMEYKNPERITAETISFIRTAEEKTIEPKIIVLNGKENSKGAIIMRKTHTQLMKNLPNLNINNIEDGSVIMVGNEFFAKIEFTLLGYHISSLIDNEMIDVYDSANELVGLIMGAVLGLRKTELKNATPLELMRQVKIASPSEYNFIVEK